MERRGEERRNMEWRKKMKECKRRGRAGVRKAPALDRVFAVRHKWLAVLSLNLISSAFLSLRGREKRHSDTERKECIFFHYSFPKAHFGGNWDVFESS